MGTKSNPSKNDCYSRALPDEPMFTLLARDPNAPHLVGEWATRRAEEIRRGTRPRDDLPLVVEAMRCAADMIAWRQDNNGSWRK